MSNSRTVSTTTDSSFIWSHRNNKKILIHCINIVVWSIDISRYKNTQSKLFFSVDQNKFLFSVERLYNQLWKSGQPAIEPLVITASGILTLTENFLADAKLIYALFYIHGSHLNDVVDTIPKSRRNRRCLLHSLETHKARASGSWIDVWDLLSQECRDEVVLIDSDSLLDTLDNYLRKHRFCSECKSKVLKAYTILSGDIDGDTEKGYCAALYEGLKSCPKERHIHVVCDTDFIAHLIGRAEPELAGGRRERHARTIDIAQEEVLTCLGIHLWERLHRLWQKLRAEEQTWQMLFYLGVEALRKSFETAVEEKQGITQLELVVEEISEAERAKEQRKENKRMKKKKRKENKAKLVEDKLWELENDNDKKPRKNTEGSDNDEKSPTEGEYSESLDGSEKSSTCNGSQISPRKTDDDEDSVSNCKSITPPSSPTHVVTMCSNKSDKPFINPPCSKPLKCPVIDTFENSPCIKDSNKIDKTDTKCVSPPFTKVTSFKSCSTKSSHQNTQNDNNKPNVCKCVTGILNGYNYHNDHHSNDIKDNNKRNVYQNNCRICSPKVGPRFNRHEDQRWKGGGDVYEKCYSLSNGRGRGKHRGQKKESCGPVGHAHNRSDNIKYSLHHTKNGDSLHHHNSLEVSSNPEVEDEGELRLLKMMGWNTEDSTGISEKEIQDFVDNRLEVQTRRQELRDHLRDQFQKMSVSCFSVNCVDHV